MPGGGIADDSIGRAMSRRNARRAAVCVIVALSWVGSSASAQDPPLGDARLEGTYLAGQSSGLPDLRFTPFCRSGPCDVDGQAYMLIPYGAKDGARKWVQLKVAYDETNYTATASYDRVCQGTGDVSEIAMPTTWRAAFSVVEAGHVDGEWRATRLAGEQQFTSPLVSRKGRTGYAACEDQEPAFSFSVDLDIPADQVSALPSEPPLITEAPVLTEAPIRSQAPVVTEAPLPTESPLPTEAPPEAPPPDDVRRPDDDVGAGPFRAGGSSSDGGERASPVAQERPVAPAVQEPLFARAVVGVSEVSTGLEDLIRSLLLVLLLIPLIVFPSHLFNSTIEANYEEIRGWFRRKRTGDKPQISRGGRWKGWPAFLIFTVVSSILYGFLDPAFGLNRTSAVQLTILALSTIILTLAFAVPTRRYMKQLHGDDGYLKVLPGALVFALVCVVASRLANFQPGYFYGVIAGFAFTRTLSKPDEGRAAARAGAFMLVLALAAWGMKSAVAVEGTTLAPSVVRAVLGGLFVGGVEGVVFAMLPLRFMSGEKLWAWNKPLWTLLMGAGLFIFVHVLLDPRAEYLANPSYTPLATVIGLFAAFGICSVAFWAYFRYRKTPSSTA